MGGFAGRQERAVIEAGSEPGVEYQLGNHVLLCGDAADLWDYPVKGSLIYDPPWDDHLIDPVLEYAADEQVCRSVIAFADGGTIGRTFLMFGEPAWLFTWDTAAPWSNGPGRPLKQTKYAAWFGPLGDYERDATPIGAPAPARNHPTTVFNPGEGRRLTDLWRQSLRWHHAGAPHPHIKPLGWVRALIGNCTSGPLFDPFAGSGQTLFAADQLGRTSYNIEADPHYCDIIRARWTSYCAAKNADPGPDALDPRDPRFDGFTLRVSDEGGHVASLKKRPVDLGDTLFETDGGVA